jgi:hypothetical protein
MFVCVLVNFVNFVVKLFGCRQHKPAYPRNHDHEERRQSTPSASAGSRLTSLAETWFWHQTFSAMAASGPAPEGRFRPIIPDFGSIKKGLDTECRRHDRVAPPRNRSRSGWYDRDLMSVSGPRGNPGKGRKSRALPWTRQGQSPWNHFVGDCTVGVGFPPPRPPWRATLKG